LCGKRSSITKNLKDEPLGQPRGTLERKKNIRSQLQTRRQGRNGRRGRKGENLKLESKRKQVEGKLKRKLTANHSASRQKAERKEPQTYKRISKI